MPISMPRFTYPHTYWVVWATTWLGLFLWSQETISAQSDEQKAQLHYEGSIAGILKSKCGVCHGDGKQEAGLSLTSYAGVIQGSGGGKIVVAGQSQQSKLIEVITTEDDSLRMPPDGDPLTKEQIKEIQQWIDQGLRENAGSSAAQMRTLGFIPNAKVSSGGEDNIPAEQLLPKNYPTIEAIKTNRPFPILGLAASPKASVVAASQYGSIALLDPKNLQSIGIVPFAEGEPLVLSFSRSGRLLLAAGGKPVRQGSAALYDVVTGKRLASVGDEPDTLQAADLSPDERFIAVGCTSRLVKIFSTETGTVTTTIDKHTDWVTALAYSPDGKMLATADRIGNIYLWDGESGGALLSLSAHKKSVRSLHWRSDSRVVVSCGEDGMIVWWDAKDGWPTIQKTDAHSQGVLDAKFGTQGELATCGRDRLIKLWSAEGTELKRFSIDSSLPLRVSLTADGEWIVAGDSSGRLHHWPLK